MNPAIPIIGLTYIACFAISLAIANKLSIRVKQVRAYAQLPITSWPRMSLREFKYCVWVREETIWEEDVFEYFNTKVSTRRLALITVIKWSEFAETLPTKEPMPAEWYEMNEPPPMWLFTSLCN